MATATHPVDEMLPAPKLFTLGLQHVLVMYAGAIAVPLIIGRALQLPPEDVAFLISADLFCCGVVSILQSLGVTPWFGVRLPVMMGVTFASVGPMVSIALTHPGRRGGADDLRLDHRRRRHRRADRADRQPHAAVLPAGGHRHDHPGDRHHADAGRHQLDLRGAGRTDRAACSSVPSMRPGSSR